MRALAELRRDRGRIQVRVEVRACRPGDTMPRPGMGVIRMLGKVVAGVDVKVPGRDDLGVVIPEHGADRGRDGRPAGHRERAAFAEVILYVDDDKRAHDGHAIA